ncbi:restriction endonuclease subunit S [Lachnospiraceae bacterium GAM79]|nr:restriction endonuclease subunit S [Lachnospiraceae bacterium GAM79]UEA77723.1 restriction endonuclease subunit S [Lachnospiraceae bacterium GAM79]
MAEWNNTYLSDVLVDKGYIRGPFGSALKRGDMKDNGIPVYEQQHAIYNSRHFRYYIDEQKFNEMKRFQVNTDDLIISCSGTVGKVSIIRSDDPKGIISQALLLLRVDQNKILPLYLKYFFTSRDGYNAIVSRSSGSVQVNIAKRNVIEQIPLMLPKIETQRKIVEILNSIDKKIEENEEINNNLEQQAQAIYQQMFIDNARSDWAEGTLSDIADITIGQSPSGSSYNEDGTGTIFFQGRAEFGFRFPSVRLYTTEPKRMARSNDTLMSVRAPVGDLNVAHTDCCIGRGLAAIHSKSNHQSFVLYTMFSLKKQLDVFNGEGTVFGSINRNSLNDMPILIPSDDILDEFERIVAPMDLTIRNNYDEICRLQDIRDTLLPRLMSGELDVSDIDI